MLLSALATAALTAHVGAPTAAPRGELAWFEGTYDELMQRAKEEDKLVLLDFWTDWCGWCDRYGRETFSDPKVVKALDDALCFTINAESREGALIARSFGVLRYPTLLFLEPDGSLRDRIGAFMTAETFVPEVERIERNEDTISSMRADLEAAPDDLALRYRLALKLRDAGDREGHARHMEAIRARDPDARTPTGRRIKFDEVYDVIRAAILRGVREDPAELIAFLELETDPKLLYKGWSLVALFYEVDTATAEVAGDKEQALATRGKTRDAYRKAYPHMPDEDAETFGNQVAWNFWLARDQISDEDKAFALAAAKRAHRAGPENTSVMDTYACCLFMTGDARRALRLIDRAEKLDPTNELWAQRRVLFGADG